MAQHRGGDEWVNRGRGRGEVSLSDLTITPVVSTCIIESPAGVMM